MRTCWMNPQRDSRFPFCLKRTVHVIDSFYAASEKSERNFHEGNGRKNLQNTSNIYSVFPRGGSFALYISKGFSLKVVAEFCFS